MNTLLSEELNRIKKIMGLNEDISFTYMNDEFLDMVKQKTPELYSKFFNLYKNKGIDYAKSAYEKYDPDVLAKKEAEIAIAQRNKREEERLLAKKNKFEELKSILPTKEEVKHILDTSLLTGDFRNFCSDEGIPQLSTSTLSSVGKKINGHTLSFKHKLNGYLEFKNIRDLLDYFEDTGNNKILDSMIRTKNTDKYLKKMNKLYKDYGIYDDFIHDDFLRPISTIKVRANLDITIQIEKNKFIRDSEFMLSIEYKFSVINNISSDEMIEKYDSIYESVNNKEDVIHYFNNLLVSLKEKIKNI